MTKRKLTYVKVSEFYDKLALDYDAMTGFEKRFTREEPFFRSLVNDYHIRTALDAGSGTGFHTFLLAQLGVSVTAVDISQEMLHRLKQHAKDRHLNINVKKSSFQNLHKVIKNTYDAIFCMGNSLAHLATRNKLYRALNNFSLLLNPGGILFIQILNFNRIMVKREKIQSVKEAKDKLFIRFYEYAKKDIQFNILTLQKKGDVFDYSLQTARLRPILEDELTQLLLEIGFHQIKTFGGITLENFSNRESQDLVILAKKSK